MFFAAIAFAFCRCAQDSSAFTNDVVKEEYAALCRDHRQVPGPEARKGWMAVKYHRFLKAIGAAYRDSDVVMHAYHMDDSMVIPSSSFAADFVQMD